MIVDAHAHIFDNPCPRVTPPEIADGCFPVERLLALMDAEGAASRKVGARSVRLMKSGTTRPPRIPAAQLTASG